jgi:hypothetical protein
LDADYLTVGPVSAEINVLGPRHGPTWLPNPGMPRAMLNLGGSHDSPASPPPLSCLIGVDLDLTRDTDWRAILRI